jgi:CelD/BcsL family acetyltransferase involved in cellulose biosynthesis
VITARVLSGFDDPSCGPSDWAQLLASGPTDAIDLTWPIQRAWWETCGEGDLLLIAAARGGNDIAVAPLFAAGGMVFNLALKDQLDFIGDTSDSDVLDALLTTARKAVPDFHGFRLYFIPDHSPTGERLREAADRLGLVCHDEGELPSPALGIASDPARADACTRKQSLRRRERWFRDNGELAVRHFCDGDDVLAQLPEFFEQHVARRAAMPDPSPFVDPAERAFYCRMTELAGDTGWLRFTRLEWDGRPIAFHYGFSYRGRYLYGVPSFAVDLLDRWPGEVLLRQLLLAAIDEGAAEFDFGIGDEDYKYRYATHVTTLRTWGLYPS